MATYTRLPTEEPEPTFAQPDTDKDDRKDKKTSVNISASCSTNNFCTGRQMYILFVAGIVCIFVFVAVYQTVLKAVVVVAAVSIIVVISYVIYFYVNKRANKATQKNGEAYANEKTLDLEEDAKSTTQPKRVITEDTESAACEEKTLLDSKTSKDDDVEIVVSAIDTVHGLHSDDAVNRTSVRITEVDTSSDETQQEDPTWRSVSDLTKDQATAFELRMSRYLPYDSNFTSGYGSVAAIDDLSSSATSLAIHRHTGALAATIAGAAFSIQHSLDLGPYFNVIAREMPADWQQLASNLGVPWEQIKAVNREHSGDCWKCCQQVLNTWRTANGRRATKEKLIQAVKETGHQDVVDKLEDEFDCI